MYQPLLESYFFLSVLTLLSLFGVSDTTLDLGSFPIFSGLDVPIQMEADLCRLEHGTSLQ